MMEELKNEKEVVRKLKDLSLEERPQSLKKMFIHTNLATRRFHKIWSDWWKTAIPPRLEVAMIPIFEEIKELTKVFMVGIEVEFFRDKTKSFCDGLHQVLSFGLFGFDSLVLWHIFAGKLENNDIEEYTKPVKEIIEGFKLPVVYFSTKLTEDFKFEFFAPWELYSSSKMDISYVLSSMRNLCNERRNPLLNKTEVDKRKRTLKVILKIPV